MKMDLENRFTTRVAMKSMLTIILLALVTVPSTGRNMSAASTEPEVVAPLAKTDAPTTSEFPFVVKFEQGATQFSAGDNITITEVRGTAETFEPGNIYWIRGTYKLGSHDQAMLAA
jgi:hypothetical protein